MEYPILLTYEVCSNDNFSKMEYRINAKSHKIQLFKVIQENEKLDNSLKRV